MVSEFAKEKVFWTKKMNIKLVKFIESKTNMWNPKHPKYTALGVRDETYAEFASKYGNEFTWVAVKDRWKNIRSTYCFYLRKLNASRAKFNGKVCKPNWYLWEPCKFLMKVSKPAILKKSPSNTDGKSDDDVQKLSQNEDLSSEDGNFADNHSLNDSNIGCEEVVDNMVSVFRGVQNDAFGIQNNDYAKIGRAVTKKLSQMNSYDAAQLSQKIVEILSQYDENNPMNPNNLNSDCI